MDQSAPAPQTPPVTTASVPPVAPAAPIAPASPAEPMPFGGYVSNPFRLTLAALGHTLQTNGIPLVYSALTMMGFWVVFFLLSVFSGIIKNGAVVGILGLVLALGFIYVAVSLMLANVRMVLEGINDRADSFKNYFAYGRSLFLKAIGLYVLAVIIALLPAIVLAFAFMPIWLRIGIMVVLEIGILIKLSLAPFALVHEKSGVVASIRRSWMLTNGHAFEVFAAVVTGSLFGGGILSQAAATSSLGGRYLQIKALKESNAPKVKPHWVNYVLGAIPIIVIGSLIAMSALLSTVFKDAFKTNTTTTPTIITPSTDYDYDYDY